MPILPPRGLHPWHDIPTGPNPPNVVTAVVEIPTNERNKYELDKKLGVFRLDRCSTAPCTTPATMDFCLEPWATMGIRSMCWFS